MRGLQAGGPRMRIGSQRCIQAAVGLVCLAAVALSLRAAAANPPDQLLPAIRPAISAVLQGGERVEGVLERFDDGVYWVLVGNQRRTFAERDLQSILFRWPIASPPLTVEDQ